MIASMARNICTFDVGNRTGEKLTPETHELFCNTLRVTGRISISAARCAVGTSTVRGWLRRGAREETGIYRSFLDDVEKARAEFLLLASRRLSQLAVGGVLQLPAYDKKTGAPLRNHRKDCPAIPGVPCGCELIVTERVLLPNANALMFQLDRSDPSPNGEPTPDLPEHPTLTDAEALAKATTHFDILVEAVQILVDLGVPLPEITGPRARTIETTATAAPEPEPGKESEPAPTPSAATIATTIEPATPTEPKSDPEAF